MSKPAFLEILIEITEAPFRMDTELGEVCMIPFKGKAQGPLFTGICEPWGVDTQTVDTAGVRHLSARYVLTGTDHTGEKCHIFIENNGSWEDAHPSRVFRTVPTFRTDSKVLASFLHSGRFYGTGTPEPEGLWIRFYEIG